MRNLFTTWYECGNEARQAELDYCLRTNCESGLFDNVFVLCHVVFPTHIPNVNYYTTTQSKPTYETFIKYVNGWRDEKYINIIANTDIIFDETIKLTDKLGVNDCWALSRWEMKPDYTKHLTQIQIYGDSQDCWIFRGKIKQLDKADFPLGKMGCDNRIAYEIKKAGYNISNPSKSVTTWHLHNTNVRGYNPAVRNEHTVVSQPYHTIPLTAL